MLMVAFSLISENNLNWVIGRCRFLDNVSSMTIKDIMFWNTFDYVFSRSIDICYSFEVTNNDFKRNTCIFFYTSEDDLLVCKTA